MIDHSSNAIPLSVEPGAATDPTSERRFRPLFAEDAMPTPEIAEPGRFDPGALATAEYREHVVSAEAAGEAATRERLERRSGIAIGIHSALLLIALVFFVAMMFLSGPEMMPGILAAVVGPPRPRPVEQLIFYLFDMIIVSGTVLLGLAGARWGLMRWARRGCSTDSQ
jgi:hypothetical protein